MISLPNAILLYGPPGCGKTFIARKLAEVARFRFMEVTPGDLASIYVHGTQGKIAELFSQAPCEIFFDELDATVPNRAGDTVGHHYASEVNGFLIQLNQADENHVLVIGATYLPDRIDLAVRRPGRLNKKNSSSVRTTTKPASICFASTWPIDSRKQWTDTIAPASCTTTPVPRSSSSSTKRPESPCPKTA